jgi:hypothetical protein
MTDQATSQATDGKLPPALTYERWPIALLVQDPHNARGHGPRNLDEIRASLKRWSQRLPVVVRQGQLVGGNATALVAAELGMTHLDVVIADDLSAAEAERLAVALNRSAELAHWRPDVLVETLTSFAGDLDGTGFSLDELLELQAGQAPLPPAPDDSHHLGRSWSVLVVCANELDQQAVLSRLTGEGYECRALIS